MWTKDGKPIDPLFGTWAALLLAQGEHALPQSSWAYILQKCAIPAHTAVALRIFELLTTPQLHLEKEWAFELGELTDADELKKKKKPKRGADYTLQWPSESDHWLEQAWNTVFRSSLATLSEPLVALVTKQLPDAVAIVTKMPLKKIFVHGLLDKLLASPILEKYPEAACEFVVAALRADDFRHLHGDLPKLHTRLKERIPRSPHLRVLEAQMYELGWKPETDGKG